MEVAVEHDDPLEALGDQAVDDRSCAAAGAEDDGVPRHLLFADEAVERDTEPGHIRVVADEAPALARDRIDGTGHVSLVGLSIDERDDSLLVRDRDVGSKEVVGTQLRDRVRQADRRAIPQLVGRVDPLVVERRLLHRPGQRMGDGMADEDDPLRHARTFSRSLKKPGYEIEALVGWSTVVSPRARRPATANVIASRWSSRLSVVAPSSERPP
jgi:hypothetical protein